MQLESDLVALICHCLIGILNIEIIMKQIVIYNSKFYKRSPAYSIILLINCKHIYYFKNRLHYFIIEPMLEEHPMIPDEAFLFFPTQTEIKPSYRKIFGGNIPFDSNEIPKLKEFDQHIQKNRLVFQEDIDDSLKLRFLQSCGYNTDKALKALVTYVKWKMGIPKQLTPKIANILSQGVCYISGRDYQYRPIVVIDVKKMVKMGFSHDDLVLTQGFFFSYIIQNIFIEGQVENWVNIIDLGNTGLLSISGPFKKSISLLSDMFRCRMHLTSVINCPGSISMLWGMAKGFVEEDTQKKISFEGGHLASKVLTIANPSQVEIKFGGTQPNITQFWPPRITSHDYKISNISNLITPEQYRKKFERGELAKRKINKKFLIKPQHQIQQSQVASNQHIASSRALTVNTNTNNGNKLNPISNNTGAALVVSKVSEHQNKFQVSEVNQVFLSPSQHSHLTPPSSINQNNSQPNFFNIQKVKSNVSESSQQYLTFDQDDDPPPPTKHQKLQSRAISTENSKQSLSKFPLVCTKPPKNRPRINYIPFDQIPQQKPKSLAPRIEKNVVAYIKSPSVNFEPLQISPPQFNDSFVSERENMHQKPIQRQNSQNTRY